jgi:GT2 family glycosyltransferase
MTPGLSIVIPTWNGLDLLKQFLPSVIAAANHYGKHSYAPTEIIIVDDGSADLTVEWLIAQGFLERASEASVVDPPAGRPEEREVVNQSHALDQLQSRANSVSEHTTPTLLFIKNETNRGFSETCNRGFEAASFPLVLLLNNDVDLARDAIAPLVENFRDSSLFAAHCRVYELESGQECGAGKLGSFARGFIRVHRSYMCLTEADPKQGGETTTDAGKLYSMFAGGGSSMFDREKFLSMGAFEPLLSPFYWEDVELSYRAWKRGYSVVYEPRSVAHHRVSSTIGKLNRRRVRMIQQRNRLIYHWVHLHDKRMLASHILWVGLLALTAPIRLQPGFISSCVAALKALPRIRARRREEKRRATRSDREVFAIFSNIEQRSDVFAYDDLNEMARQKQAKKIVRE